MNAVPSPVSGATPAGRQPSTGGYWIAAAVFLLGTVGSIIWFVVSIVNTISLPDGFDRIPVPGERTIRLEEGEWTLYHEYRGATTGFAADPDVVITGPDGDEVPVRSVTVEESYEVGGREGRAFGKFTADVAGAYTVTVLGEPGGRSQQVAVGQFVDLSSVLGIVGSIVVGAIAFFVAVTVLVITLVRRSRWKKLSGAPRTTAAPYGGASPGGAWGAPVPPAPTGTAWGSPPPAATPPVPPGPTPPPPPAPPPPSSPPAAAPPPQGGWAAPGEQGSAAWPPTPAPDEGGDGTTGGTTRF